MFPNAGHPLRAGLYRVLLDQAHGPGPFRVTIPDASPSRGRHKRFSMHKKTNVASPGALRLPIPLGAANLPSRMAKTAPTAQAPSGRWAAPARAGERRSPRRLLNRAMPLGETCNQLNNPTPGTTMLPLTDGATVRAARSSPGPVGLRLPGRPLRRP